MKSFIVLALTSAMFTLSAAPLGAEDFRIELTVGYWPLTTSGDIQTTLSRINLKNELGIEGRKGHPTFKIVGKPGLKHRLLFELIPYRFEGSRVIGTTFVLGGRTYPVQDTIASEASIDYFFGGYQYDFVNNSRGHAGVTTGVAYFGARASATSQTLGVTGTEDRTAGIPLVGGEFRSFPIPTSNVLSVSGEAKGMSLGSYGWYFQTGFNIGVAPMRYVRLQAGFNFAEGDFHRSDRRQGFNPRFSGPIFSLQLHD